MNRTPDTLPCALPLRRLLVAVLAAAVTIGAACGGGSGGGHRDDGPPYTVSGTMLAAAGSAIDSDTNDRSAPFLANNSASQAQELGNPVTLGGHVNVAGAGSSSGRTTLAGDTQDWFRVSLAKGQTVRLRMVEETPNNLDLELRAQNGSLVASSATASQTEEVPVAASGDYYVVVVARAGSSSYTLTIGQTPASAARESEFVPGQVIVLYRDQPGISAAIASSDASPEARAKRVGMRHVRGGPGAPMLFAAETLEERRAAFRALGLEPTAEMRSAALSRGDRGDERRLRDDTRRLVQALRRRPDVQSAALNYVRRPTAVPADEFYPYQWHLDLIHLPPAWDVVAPNSNVRVAVLDTGVKAGHPDLAGQLVAGYDFVSDPTSSNDGDGCDSNPDDPGDVGPGGGSFHGTHVTGTVVARTSFQSGDDIGVASVAWNARVMPLRVLGVDGGTDFDIMAALQYAARLPNACGVLPTAPARIVNMSLGGPDFSQPFQDLITQLRTTRNMIFVAAAGNDASTAPFYPAAYDGVISVSAVGPTKTLAPYSSFGPTIDVAAPGGDFERDVDGDGFPDGVLSTFFSGNDYGYAFYQGTSMATPHVAGVIALMLGINPALTPFDIDNLLNAGDLTENIGSSQFFGHGLIDAAKAVDKAAEVAGGAGVLDPVLRVDPDALNYGFIASSFQISAINAGNDQAPLAVLSATFSSDDGTPWLTIAPEVVDGRGLGTYRANVNRSGLADGLYTGKIHFNSDVNDVDVSVIMQVGNPSTAQANAGHHYILLVEPGTFETVDSRQADASGGSYSYSFTDVPPGDYLLIAGTDLDDDSIICDAGEACGAFPTTESIATITLNRDRTDFRFVTGFGVDVGASSASVGTSRRGYSTEIGGRPPDDR